MLCQYHLQRAFMICREAPLLSREFKMSERKRQRQKKRNGARDGKVVTASFSVERSGIACIFITLISICAVRERVATWKKKKTHTVELVKFARCSAPVQLWERWMSYLIKYPMCRSSRHQGRTGGNKNRTAKLVLSFTYITSRFKCKAVLLHQLNQRLQPYRDVCVVLIWFWAPHFRELWQPDTRKTTILTIATN